MVENYHAIECSQQTLSTRLPRELEKRHILTALRESKGNRTHAARMLDISIRTLRNKLNEYNFKGSYIYIFTPYTYIYDIGVKKVFSHN